MQFADLDIIAPAIVATNKSDAEVLGAVVWLWMQSKRHREAPIKIIETLIMPAIKNAQFVLALKNTEPVGYIAWANLSADAEYRYLQNGAAVIDAPDWKSGDRMWITDFVTPSGHGKKLLQIIRGLIANSCSRSVHHRSRGKNLRITHFRGTKITKEQEKLWWQARPLKMQVEQYKKEEVKA